MNKYLMILFFTLIPLCEVSSMTFGVSPLLHFPFGPSTQKDDDGGVNTLTFHPGIGIDLVMPFFGSTLFVPEVGYVMHRGEEDGYSKSTLFILYDVAYKATPTLLLRYGVGTFMTRIGGDGGAVTMKDGDGTQTFYRPNETVVSYTSTVNLGAELLISSSAALRVETFTSGILSSVKRKVSHTFQFIYYF